MQIQCFCRREIIMKIFTNLYERHLRRYQWIGCHTIPAFTWQKVMSEDSFKFSREHKYCSLSNFDYIVEFLKKRVDSPDLTSSQPKKKNKAKRTKESKTRRKKKVNKYLNQRKHKLRDSAKLSHHKRISFCANRFLIFFSFLAQVISAKHKADTLKIV